MSSFSGFPRDAIEFLHDLSENNNREWFAKNKSRFEANVQAPALELIAALRKPLEKVAPMLQVEPKKVGGSLMRIYKDTRFSQDKTPYKTNIGIQFRHLSGKDVHAPGVYLHIEPNECFVGAGAWRPDASALHRFRAGIVDQPAAWKRATRGAKFAEQFSLYDDRLKTVPRGYDKDHPLIDDLRLKSFLVSHHLDRAMIESPQLVSELPKLIKACGPLMRFLCEALGQPY